MANNEVNSDNYLDDQIYDTKIDQLYEEFIKEIDDIRSYVPSSVYLSKAFDSFNLDKISTNMKVESTPQESRCHAFYRLIGFPVAEPDNSYYNPGFYKVKSGSDDFNKKRQGIVSKMPKALLDLLNKREYYLDQYKKIFQIQNIDASVLAISSWSLRKFSDPLKNIGDPFDTNLNSYSIKDDIESIFIIPLSNYVDENNNPIDPASPALNFNRFHLIRPFIVNPRIDISVSPSSRRVAVPFTSNKSETLISNNTYIKRPYLELICRRRFDGRNKNDTLTATQSSFIDFIKNNDSFKDAEIIKKINLGPGFVDENAQFIKFFNLIKSMIKNLVKAEDLITKAIYKTLWIPVPDKKGPEFGSSTRDLILGDPNIITSLDVSIQERKVKDNINKIISDVLVNTQTDLGNYSFENILNFADKSDAVGDVNVDDLNSLQATRKELCDKANQALKEIEIIMGEFSGFGLCDIIAVYAALSLIDKKYLLAFLDDEAFERMKNFKELQNDAEVINRTNGNKASITEALTEFEKKVKEIYELMDKAYLDQKNLKNENS